MGEPGGVAIVTGASRGIGRAVARALAEAGYRVVVNYREREGEARALVDSIAAAGGQAHALRADVGVPEESRALVRSTLEMFGRVDVLVNNAGVHLPGVRLADVPPADWERILRVNLSGPFHLIQAVVPPMRARRSGHIVNLSSNVTQRFPAASGPYTVSKSGLDALTRILAKEEGPHGIRVNAVAPGPIATDMLGESLDALGPERAEAFVRSVPLGRTGRPEEIAAVVRFLVSDEASYLTGQVIYVNGGGPGSL
ncbi:MAG TPA: 3-oxoacyl-ACP reductase family protein [Methylomirabilota bacterium]|jgi:3-oxoacyl-[acyl-carrier protein] reductase|nr:3-oxoacyl-ACP reductase family protein [Methylomirabilota bacterium]